jgi:pimeloyl-ACP methyl ester carboxylesterase
MRYALTVLLLLLPQTKSIDGIWLGTLDLGAKKLRIAVTVSGTTATLNSLDQNSGEMPLSEVSFTGGKFKFALPQLGATYEGTLAGDAIAGTFHQRGLALPLTFARVDAIPVPKRPQEPKRPYPYAEEEVVVTNGEVTLAGTLTLPRATPPFDAVVLISGSGPQDRDETIFGHKPFLVLADHLTRRGIAVLRVDDRGTGKSTGKRSGATTDDYAADTLACVNFLRARKDIAKIGLIGHSEGGFIAPIVATRSKDVAFLVLLGAPGLPGEQLVERQAASLFRSIGANDEEVARAVALQRQILAIARETPDETALRAKLVEVMTKSMANLSAEERTLFANMTEMINSQVKRLSSPWYRWMLAYDPRPVLRAVRVPILAINGGKDIQVEAKANLAAIAAAAPHARIVELANLNHLLQTAQTGAMAEYAAIEETLAPVVLETIAGWIAEMTRKRVALRRP